MRGIGVRMALGADAGAGSSGWSCGTGGVWCRRDSRLAPACALIAAPLLGRFLFGVSAFDPLTMLGVPTLLGAGRARRLLSTGAPRVAARAPLPSCARTDSLVNDAQ